MGNVEIPNWLKGLPLAPVYRPTDTEFADPIAYVSKIEKEASAFGICKIIPPLPKPSKKYVFHNFNKSLSKCPELGSDVDVSKICSAGDGGDNAEVRAVFTTRQQELGHSGKRTRGDNSSLSSCQKQVWQSGEVYTLEQFESKSKAFARNQLGSIKEVSPLVIEALFWKAATEKAIYVEYANDVPGSAFGEPEIKCRSFHRRRRKRGSYRRKEKGLDSEGSDVIITRKTSVDGGVKIAPVEKDFTSSEAPKPSTMSCSSFDESSRDMEGTAGWKLANSPWNLQVIARSAGSLTRFMPDDIPGVTSPMVYVGMLFSWFAWHIEDHELHSMNFLHTGSAKTWYAVPGDYVFDFEEVIRTEAYGGNIDRLAALSLLGEKTTLLSPEVIVGAGIPCCRLMQYPGEFVVTFPRAYHVGFSHGFNCGEAANFGTSQWLNVAKDAAVRRAAMNYLPMLSHQQLLYLLTMSFVSRVPRSLLPGARSSRLRDRQREERELLVKRAFIEDMLRENAILSVVLGKEPTCRAVLWDPDLLPRQTKESQLVGAETTSHGNTESNIDDKQKSLLEELSFFMENLNDLYFNEDDDLLNDFHVDYGTLACVACGILGFPFMAVVQPSEKASKELPIDNPLVQGEPTTPGVNQSESAARGNSEVSLPRKQIDSSSNFGNNWNFTSRCSRPRIFCLEHTLQVQKLLHQNGGASVLVICHKDYQKIKAHATTVAEEVSVPFDYTDVPLEDATEEELNLIDLAVDDEENNENGEDWTCKLGINLQFCVKVRKVSPTKKVQHALDLGGLFSEKSHDPGILNVNWQNRSRRSRLGVKSSTTFHHKTFENAEVKSSEMLGVKSGSPGGRRDEKIIQYSRRKKLKPDSTITDAINNGSGLIINAGDCMASKNDLQLKVPAVQGCISSYDTLVDQPTHAASVGDSRRGSKEIPAEEMSSSGTSGDEVLQETKMHNEDDRELALNAGRVVTQPCCVSKEENSNSEGIQMCTTAKEDDTATLEDESEHVEVQSNGIIEVEAVLASSAEMELGQPKHMVKECLATLGNSCDDKELISKTIFSEIPSGAFANEMAEICETSDNQGARASRNGLPLCSSSEPMNNPSSAPIRNCTPGDDIGPGNSCTVSEFFSLESNAEKIDSSQSIADPNSNELMGLHRSKNRRERKRKREAASETEKKSESYTTFIRSPCEGLRPRVRKEEPKDIKSYSGKTAWEKPSRKKAEKPSPENGRETLKGNYQCHIEGCRMTFETKEALQMHKRNRCPFQDCGKKFRAHKYAVLHQRVHEDDRPLKCPWKGCTMSFKWAWARTEHIRLHTGERPYKCQVEGCGLSFRFVSDFSRHRRKTGHYV